ncbi:MAG TPA: glycosyltransferase, partial [Kofleriaceae bacterium]|nr:glycosyltransferase [Kofleriaceae bacterium]
RRPSVEALPGIPTIRVFEALACGIPLVSTPWRDDEGLFTAGEDFLVARDADEMRRSLRAVLHDRVLAAELAQRGRETILARHTCGHRVDELFAILAELGVPGAAWRREPAGLWVGDGDAARKLAACGIHLRRGVAIHGFALDVDTPPEMWRLIVPCGLGAAPVTSLSRLTGGAVPSVAEVARRAGPRVVAALSA